MAVISDEYKALIRENHEEWAKGAKPWGQSARRNLGDRMREFIIRRPGIKTILDYGCGQRTLEKYIMEENPIEGRVLEWYNYDPGLPEFDKVPEVKNGHFDLVTSCDVLEHIEPDQIDSVIEHMHKLTKHYQYHCISCDPCRSKLPDGSNAHLIVETPKWWKDKFTDPQKGTIMLWNHEEILRRKDIRTNCYIQIDR